MDHQNCVTPMPDNAVRTHAICSAKPMEIIRISPNRLIRFPVKNAGANMPTPCEAMTKALSSKLRPHSNTMAIGVAVISRFMVPWPTSAAMVATMKTGWHMILVSGRRVSASWLGVSFGMSRHMSTAALNSVLATRNT